MKEEPGGQDHLQVGLVVVLVVVVLVVLVLLVVLVVMSVAMNWMLCRRICKDNVGDYDWKFLGEGRWRNE